jgi:hypothetical protein
MTLSQFMKVKPLPRKPGPVRAAETRLSQAEAMCLRRHVPGQRPARFWHDELEELR